MVGEGDDYNQMISIKDLNKHSFKKELSKGIIDVLAEKNC